MSYLVSNPLLIIEAASGVSFGYAMKKLAIKTGDPLPVSQNTLTNLVTGKIKPQVKTLERIFKDAIDHQPEMKPIIDSIIESSDEGKVNRELFIFFYRSIFRVEPDTMELGYMQEQLDKLIEFDDSLMDASELCEAVKKSQFRSLFPRQDITKLTLQIWAGLFVISACDTLFMALRFKPRENACVEYGLLGRCFRSVSQASDLRNAIVAAAWQSIQDDVVEYSVMDHIKEGLALEPNDNEPHKVAKALLCGKHELNGVTLKQTLRKLFQNKVQFDIAEISIFIAYGFKRGFKGAMQEDLTTLRLGFDCYPQLLAYHKRGYQEWRSRQ